MKAKIYDDNEELVFECDIPESLAVFIQETFERLEGIDSNGEPGGGPDDDPPED